MTSLWYFSGISKSRKVLSTTDLHCLLSSLYQGKQALSHERGRETIASGKAGSLPGERERDDCIKESRLPAMREGER